MCSGGLDIVVRLVRGLGRVSGGGGVCLAVKGALLAFMFSQEVMCVVGKKEYGRGMCVWKRWEGEMGKERTFAILARRKERMRNLNLSSSVCVIMRLKFAEGSIVPVMSSTVSIYFFGRVSCQLFFLLLVFVPRVLCSWLDGGLWFSPSQPAFLLRFSLLLILLRGTLTSFYHQLYLLRSIFSLAFSDPPPLHLNKFHKVHKHKLTCNFTLSITLSINSSG